MTKLTRILPGISQGFLLCSSLSEKSIDGGGSRLPPSSSTMLVSSRMDVEVGAFKSELDHKVLQGFKDLMTGVASLEELVAAGNKLLVGFQPDLELLRRPTVNLSSELVEKIVKANESKTMMSYFEAGCVNVHDSVQSMTSSNSIILDELECLTVDATAAMQTANESLANQDVDSYVLLPDQEIIKDKGEAALPDSQNPEVADYATLMAIISNMMKHDFLMQERTVSALVLKLPSGELESYCLMWSLRPFINDELMREAWKLVH